MLVEHYFVRHGDNDGSLHEPLTPTGYQEARSLHHRLTAFLPLTSTLAFSADNSQSVTSLALMFDPTIRDNEAEERGGLMVKTGRITLDPRLRYAKFGTNDEAIKSAYQTVYDARETLRFYTEESDKYLEINSNYSTYATLSQVMARVALDRFSLATSSLNCAKQFAWPVFRAQLIERTQGAKSRDTYVDWYLAHKEPSVAARLDICRLFIKNNTVHLEDNYEPGIFSVEALYALAKSNHGNLTA